MSDELKINLPAASAETEPTAEIVPILQAVVIPSHVREARETEQPLPFVEQGSLTGSDADSRGGGQSPSLRPSPISGVTPPIATRWKKGCPSPNPGGRPKITREETAKWLEEKCDDGKTNARKAIESVGEVAQSAGRHSATALKTLHDILPDDKKDEPGKGGFNIGTLNMAILTQITRAATQGELE